MWTRIAATSNTPPAALVALPADVRLMNAIAAGVFVLGTAGLFAAGTSWLARRPFFDFRAIELDGDLARNSVTTVRANALPHLHGNYFTLNLRQAEAAFEQVPWVRHAMVQRVWPDRLVVTLEEHQPVAIWTGDENSDTMVNSLGEVFEANIGDVEDEGLPEFTGPQGSSAEVLQMYRRVAPVVQPLDGEIASIAMSGRGSWRLELDSGTTLELGRGTDDEVIARTARFMRTLPQVTHRFHAPLASADLRHADGYAIKLKGVTVAADPPKGAATPSREE
ncbi:MAG TPA: cell division protein FtsQ/DivIB [Burkholderiaceae bacterium]|jgi:cell division protein FtsQ|nr:cell division protein FtsQ/DivIB [Burkholderiaceae bacterium]